MSKKNEVFRFKPEDFFDEVVTDINVCFSPCEAAFKANALLEEHLKKCPKTRGRVINGQWYETLEHERFTHTAILFDVSPISEEEVGK